ncbi:MAG: hypothetical protein AVDCRST_MAG10-1587, partial [uncultured Acidimicrobiales bacterium]
ASAVNRKTDHVLLRHPRPAGHPALDHLRAGQADGGEPAQLLAPGREQAVRGAQEAGGAWPGRGADRSGGPAPEVGVQHHPGRPRGPAGLARRARRGRRPRVRGTGQGVLRRAGDQGAAGGESRADRRRPAGSGGGRRRVGRPVPRGWRDVPGAARRPEPRRAPAGRLQRHDPLLGDVGSGGRRRLARRPAGRAPCTRCLRGRRGAGQGSPHPGM